MDDNRSDRIEAEAAAARRERQLDEALEASFPASDPVSPWQFN